MWQRPKEDCPRKWLDFVCEKTKQKFVIKDLTPEYYDIALGYMTNIFLTESAICKPLRILEDPVSRLQLQQKWLKILKSNTALICCTDDDEVPRVAAINFTVVREKGMEEVPREATTRSKHEQFTQVVGSSPNEELMAAGDLFRRFGADRYLWALGLFVLPEFRGLGIATHLLKSRIVMCKALGLRGTANVFSAGAQAAARSAGYGALAERDFMGQRLVLMGTSVQI